MGYIGNIKINNHFKDFFSLFVWGSILLHWFGVVLDRIVGLPFVYFVPIVLVFSFIIESRKLKVHIRVTDLIFVATIVLLYLLLWATNTDNFIGYENDVPKFLLSVLPYFFVGLVIDQSEHSLSFWWISFFTLIVEFLYIVVYNQNRIDIETEYSSKMSFAFSLLPHVLYLWLYSFKRKKIIHFVPAVFGLIFLLSLGNRGSIMQTLFFIITAMFLFSWSNKNKFVFVIYLLFFGLIYNFLDSILLFFTVLFDQLGLSSRVINFMLSDDVIAGGSGRDILWAKLWDEIMHNPIIGQGLYADRAIINNYSHNFIIELLVSFGFPIVILLLFILSLLFIKAFGSFVTTEEKAFLILLLCCGFGVNMTSGTIWLNKYVFMSIGYAVTLIRKG